MVVTSICRRVSSISLSSLFLERHQKRDHIFDFLGHGVRGAYDELSEKSSSILETFDEMDRMGSQKA